MDHPFGGASAAVLLSADGPSGWTAVFRTVAFLGTALIAGIAVLRPFAGAPTRAASITVSFAAAVAVPCVLVTVNRPPAALLLAALTFLAALTLARTRRACGFGAVLAATLAAVTAPDGAAPASAVVGAVVWLGSAVSLATAGAGARRALWWTFGLSAVVTAAGAARASVAGAPGPIIAVGVLLTVATLLALPALARRAGVPQAWGGAAVGAVALVTAVPVAAVAMSDPAEPGVPLLRTAADGRSPILVIPHRPGWNLLHATGSVEVGTDRDRLRAAAPFPGASGRWAMVRLPAGPGRLWVREGGRVSSVPFDTGRRARASEITWTDGPECASAVLGALVAGRAAALRSCPGDRLGERDAESLRAAVTFVAGRRVDAITLRGDSSPRSQAAARLVHAEARRRGIAVSGRPRPDRPLLIISGWSAAHADLLRVAQGRLRGAGTYLAPWLLASPLLTIPAGQLVPLRFSPRDELPLKYAAALQEVFPGEPPTGAGYDGWLLARRSAQPGTTHLYAASVIRFPAPGGGTGHAHERGGWLPEGTITAVSGPLE